VKGRKKLERELDRLIDRASKLGLLDEISSIHANAAKRVMHLMGETELRHMRLMLKTALVRGTTVTVRKQ